MHNMKKLYSFTVNKETTKEVEKVVKNAEGKEEKVTEKVTISEPHTFFIRKPTRSLRDDAELFKGKKYKEAITNDLMPAALLTKRLINDEGIFSEQEKQKHEELKTQLLAVQAKLAKAGLVPEKDRNDEQKKEVEDLIQEVNKLRGEMAKYQVAELSVFDNTVEVYVRNKTIFFYTLFLAYKQDGDKELPYFGEDLAKDWNHNYKSKLAKFDDYEEQNDSFINRVINKFLHVVTIWFITGEEDEVELRNLVEPAGETDVKVTPP